MKITVSGKQIDIGNSLKDYVEEKILSVVGKYFDNALKSAVSFSREGSSLRCDISTHPSSGVLVQASGSSPDAYSAFDDASVRLGKQLSRYKQKFTEHHNITHEEVAMTVLESQADDASAEDAPMVIAEMEYYIPTCTVGVAVLRMDLADLPALMFKNIKDGKLNMVYRRKDGNIGWIDPQAIKSK